MLVRFKVSDKATLDQECKDVKQAFAFLAYSESVFGVKRCGNCESTELSLCHRTPQGFEYFSVKCNDCGHELKFGQQKENGRLFPKGWVPGYSKSDSDNQDSGANDDGEAVGSGNGRKQRDEIAF